MGFSIDRLTRIMCVFEDKLQQPLKNKYAFPVKVCYSTSWQGNGSFHSHFPLLFLCAVRTFCNYLLLFIGPLCMENTLSHHSHIQCIIIILCLLVFITSSPPPPFSSSSSLYFSWLMMSNTLLNSCHTSSNWSPSAVLWLWLTANFCVPAGSSIRKLFSLTSIWTPVSKSIEPMCWQMSSSLLSWRAHWLTDWFHGAESVLRNRQVLS